MQPPQAATHFFVGRRKSVRTVGRTLFFTAAARYFEAGHTPITSIHEIISFFAWSIACCYLTFRWHYPVKNFGSFAAPLVALLMLAAAA